MKTSFSNLAPVRFRLILVSLMIMVVALSIAGFVYARGLLGAFADDVSQTVANASSSENNLTRLNTLESELKRLRGVNERAMRIAAESQSYQYQNQIIADLNDYASQSGLIISRFDFTAATAGAAPASPATGTPAATPVGGGLKSTKVNVTLEQPVNYSNLLTFMKRIEQNLTKMQIANIALNRDPDNASSVSTDSLSIEVYIK